MAKRVGLNLFVTGLSVAVAMATASVEWSRFLASPAVRAWPTLSVWLPRPQASGLAVTVILLLAWLLTAAGRARSTRLSGQTDTDR